MTVEEEGMNDENDDDNDENLPFSISPKQLHSCPSRFGSTTDYFPFGLELDCHYQGQNRNLSTTVRRTVTVKDTAFLPAIQLKVAGGGK